MIGQAAEKASEPAGGDGHGERHGEQIARAAPDSGSRFDPFHGGRSPQQRSYHGLATHQVNGIGEVAQGERGVFEPEQNFAAESRAKNGRRDHCVAFRGGEEVTGRPPAAEIQSEAYGVSERFQNPVRADVQGPESDKDGEMNRHRSLQSAIFIRGYGRRRGATAWAAGQLCTLRVSPQRKVASAALNNLPLQT